MARRIVFFVEEPSMEAFLRALLPRLLPQDCDFVIHPVQGKQDLLKKIGARLQGYAAWLPEDWRIVVVVDRDDEDCIQLKRKLERFAAQAGLRTRRNARSCWQLVNRIAIEELEAWYFGDWDAVRAAYPRVPATVPRQSRYRNPDAIAGGTWEAFERILQRHGYFKGGLLKIEVARTLGRHFDPFRCRSKSFAHFRDAVMEAAGTAGDLA